VSLPSVGVLALQGDVGEHVHALDQVGVRARLVRRPSELGQCDALVLPGGESTTMSRLAVTFELLEPLRAAAHSGMPMFGTCAGMILLAERLVDRYSDQHTIGGIDMTVRRNAFGRQVDSFETELSLPAVSDEPVPAVFIRAPWVEDVGPQVEVLARLAADDTVGSIVAVRQGSLVATSFHPELTPDTRIHRWFVESVVNG